MSADTASKRVSVEISEEARARLKTVAAARRLTVRALVEELAERAERETFGAGQGTADKAE